MPVKQIVIFTQSPFSRRDHERLGVELLSKRFAVKIFDCTPWMKPAFAEKYGDVVHPYPGYVAIADSLSFLRELDGLHDALAIDYLGDDPPSARVRRELHARGIRRAVIQSGLLPEPTRRPGRWRAILRGSTPKSLVSKLYQRAVRALQRDPPPDIAMMSGLDGLRRVQFAPPTRQLWAHSFDFDTYLATDSQPRMTSERYAVFLDEDMVHHSDFEHGDIRTPATEAGYYGSMNRAFEEFERAHGYPIVIAAHPRSRYDRRPHLWAGRRIEHGNTAPLVRDAQLVLCHQSTAVSFAVLWRKPLVFLTTDQLLGSYLEPRIVLGSTLLGAPLINVDTDREQLASPSLALVDEEAYTQYAEAYIKRGGTPLQPAWQIFSEYVEQQLD